MNIFATILSILMITPLFAETLELQETNPDAKQMSVENGLRPKILIEGDLNRKANILKRMKEEKVPCVSLAIINDGRVEWVRGYGHITNDQNSAAIDEHTLFQAGSISKPVTAFGALILVQQGKIFLDADVNLYLKRWKVPENEFTKTEKVTLRRLLTHTAGTSVHGFPGYSAQAAIPNIIDILEGKKPLVNTDPIRVISKPGTVMKYSGGGTTIVQLLIEDITGKHFDVWMQDNVLKPLGMSESTFTQPLPPSYAIHAAYGHHHGKVVEGKWHVYPEMAAAGLWTTPKDLAQFVLYIQAALKDEKTKPLHPDYVKEMVTRQKIGGQEIDIGLGLFLKNQGKDLEFSHNGQDEGFIASLVGYAFRGQGVVIMINDDSGWALMNEITNSVADAYHWPHFEPIIKKTVKIDPSTYTRFLGQYKNEEDEIEISMIGSQLFADSKSGFGLTELHPSGKCVFFVQQEDSTIEFANCEGKSDHLTLIDSKGKKTVFNKK